MKVVRNDPPPSPPPTFDLTGLTPEEASVLMHLAEVSCQTKSTYFDAKRRIHYALERAGVTPWKP